MPNAGFSENLILRSGLEHQKISEMNAKGLGPTMDERKKKNKTKIIMHIYNYLKDIYGKILRYKNDLKTLDAHLRTKTTPECLYFKEFPGPLLKFDARYVDIHNKIIVETQIRIMVETVEYITSCIRKLEEEATVLKRSLGHFITDVDEKVKQIYDTEMARIAEETSELINMDSANPEFNMSFYRAYRFVSKPFTAERLINAPSKKISAATYTKLAREQKLPEMNRYRHLAAQQPVRTVSNSCVPRSTPWYTKENKYPVRSRSKSKLSRRNSRSSSYSVRAESNIH